MIQDLFTNISLEMDYYGNTLHDLGIARISLLHDLKSASTNGVHITILTGIFDKKCSTKRNLKSPTRHQLRNPYFLK